MAFPWVLAAVGAALVYLSKTSGTAPGSAPTSGPGAAPGLPPGPLGSAQPDAQQINRIDSQLAPVFLAQLAQRSALGTGNERVIGPANAGENAAAWIAQQVALGRVVLCTVAEDPGRLVAVPPGGEAQYAMGPNARWAVLASPGSLAQQGQEQGGLGGLLGGLGGLLGGQPPPWTPPQVPSQLPSQAPQIPVPQAPGALTSPSDWQEQGGYVVMRPDALPAFFARLSALQVTSSMTPVALGEEERVLTAQGGPNAMNAALWATSGIQAGRSILLHMDQVRIRAVPPGPGEGIAAAHSDWGIVARPAAPGQLPAALGGSPPPPPPAPPPGAPPGLPAQPWNMPPPGVLPDPFAGLPDAQRAAVMAAIATNDPARMRAAADQIQAQSASGAAALRKGAADVENARRLTAIAEGRIHRIRPGDLASNLAQWYFGNANKWRDLCRYNGIPIYTGGKLKNTDWYEGRDLELMPGAMVEKGLPPVASAKPSAPPPPSAPPAPPPPSAPPAPSAPPNIVASAPPPDFNPTL